MEFNKPLEGVRWVMSNGGEGVKPGSFFETIIRAIALADPQNKRLLASIFPDYVRAFDEWYLQEKE